MEHSESLLTEEPYNMPELYAAAADPLEWAFRVCLEMVKYNGKAPEDYAVSAATLTKRLLKEMSNGL